MYDKWGKREEGGVMTWERGTGGGGYDMGTWDRGSGL